MESFLISPAGTSETNSESTYKAIGHSLSPIGMMKELALTLDAIVNWTTGPSAFSRAATPFVTESIIVKEFENVENGYFRCNSKHCGQTYQSFY